MRTVISLTVGLLLVAVTSLLAQQAPPVEVGSRVRVTAIDLGLEKQSASLQGLRGDTLDLFVAQDVGSIVSVPLASVTEFATLQSTSRRTVIGALIGSAVGFSAGVIVLAVAHEGCEGGGFFSWGRRYCGTAPPEAELAAVAGALLGAGVGAVVGYFIKTDRWEEVQLDRLRVSFAPQREGGFALGLSVEF